MYALVRLCYNGALRIQDAIGLKFSDINNAPVTKKGSKILSLKAKKTTSRKVTLQSETLKAVKLYQDDINGSDDTVMFEPGSRRNPANKTVKQLSRFYKKHSLNVMSHDFRTTKLTDLWN